ncbi:hypothetical protein M569_07310 [Genlisea aurea]|uniref:Uncharacterized protein n=1 Tax=Genlisea aurea TaxID=192259 RepID=S8DWB7_9LAMI|nr:hypothetical protein M569_07310 [Genlisea aurea]
MIDHLLGCDGAGDVSVAMERAREAIDSGEALKKLMAYVKKSNSVAKKRVHGVQLPTSSSISSLVE